MKKKNVILLAAAAAVLMAGCGDNNDNSVENGTENGTENTEAGAVIVSESGAFDIKGSDYVTLCDYSAIEITLSEDYTVSDEDVTAYFEQLFAENGPFYTADPDKQTVGEGDIVNVDYVGKLDGVAFDRGSAENQNIDVDNNCMAGGMYASGFIDGFSDGLKGASVGDVIDWEVTFPEEYDNAELAGKQTVFTFTVNSIQKEMSVDEVDDSFAQTQFAVDTVEEMYKQIRLYLEDMADQSRYMELYDTIQDYLVANCTVEIPQDYVQARVNDYRKQFVRSYCDGNEEQLADYVSQNMGTTLEELEKEWHDDMEEGVSWELIMSAIAEKEGITLNEEDYETFVSSVVSGNGYGTKEAMYELYGYGDVVYGEKYVKDLYVYNLTLDKVMDMATVHEGGASDAEEAAGTDTQEPEEIQADTEE